MLDAWQLASVLAKTVLYFGVLTGSGLLIAHFVFASHLRKILKSIKGLALSCVALAAVAAVLVFLLRGVALTGDASGMSDPEMLGLLWQTPVGSALVLRLASLGVMMLGLIAGGIGWWFALLGAGGALWSFATVGHVADNPATWTSLVLFFHLVAVSFWIGILFPLGILAKRSDAALTAGKLGHQFGQIASVVIPLLLLAGVVLGWQLVGSLTALFSTDYGLSLLAKLAGVGLLLGLGALNKIRIVPRLLEGDGTSGRTLAKSLKVEWVVFVIVLAVTAALTTFFAVPTK